MSQAIILQRSKLFVPLCVVLGVLAVVCSAVAQEGASGLRYAAAANNSVTASPVDRLFEEGFALQKAQKTDEAIKKYLLALEADPDHVRTLYEIGWSYYVLQRWQDVVNTWERVLELQPKHPEAARFLAEARANFRLDQAVPADPNDLAALGPDAIAPKEGGTIRFALGGDTMLGSPLSRSGLPKDGGGSLLDLFRDEMRAADITFLNLEGVLLDSGRSHKCADDSKSCYAFRSPTAYVDHLVSAGVDVVSVANNHANDFGSEGLQSTRATLAAAGLLYSGPSGHETIMEHDGVRIGLLAFSTSPGQNDLRRIAAAQVLVSELAAKTDLVVVSFHGGAEGSEAQHVLGTEETFYGEDRGNVAAFAHAVIDVGADLVVGHGPHVLRGVEIYRQRLVFYSLGNFCTYGGFNLRGPLGLTMLAVVDLYRDGRFAGGKLLPGRQVPPGIPRQDPEREAIRTIRSLSQADLAATAPTILDDGTVLWEGR